MRKLSGLLFIAISFILSGSYGQSSKTQKAIDDQKKAYEVLAQNAPPSMPPSDRIFMKATIGGRSWSAGHLIPETDTRTTSYRVYGEEGGVSISFYVYIDRRYLKPGLTHDFSEGSAVDFETNDEVVFYGGRKGKYVITKVDDAGFEGTFFFTANSVRSKNVIEVENGVFRFPFPKHS
jgi:hypothetical protein